MFVVHGGSLTHFTLKLKRAKFAQDAESANAKFAAPNGPNLINQQREESLRFDRWLIVRSVSSCAFHAGYVSDFASISASNAAFPIFSHVPAKE
jgi:hypothetical protein